jgi:hypothetical protein
MSATRKAALYSALAVGLVIACSGLAWSVRVVPAVLVVATFLGALAFIGVYLRRHWRTPVGLNLMALAVVMLIETGLGIAAIIWGTNWPARDQIRVVAWALICWVLWWRVGLLFAVRLGAAPPPLPPGSACPTCGQLVPDPNEPNIGAHHRRLVIEPEKYPGGML